MRKLIGLILAVIAVFFLITIGKGIVSLPETQQKLKDAPFIDDGQLHPEYDGQLVIVSGLLESEQNAYDDELGITLPAPCIVRYVEMLTDGVDEDGYDCLVWTPVHKSSTDDWLKERVIASGLHLGAYQIDESLLQLLVPGKDVPGSLFDPDEVQELMTHSIKPIEYLGVYYLSEAPASCFDQYVYDYTYRFFRRVHYRMMEPDTELLYSIAGRANDGTLTRDDDLDTQPVFEGASTRDDVVRQNGTYSVFGMILVGVICVILLLVGLAKFR